MASEFDDVRRIPKSISAERAREHLAAGSKGFHESMCRSWHILSHVKDMLEKKNDPDLVRRLIRMMEDDLPGHQAQPEE